jgi:hypothetical protein
VTRIATVCTCFAALLALASPARASQPVDLSAGPGIGLPLVPTPGGWARYLANASDGPAQFVIKVAGPGRAGGEKGTWIAVETEVPDLGRVTLELLVVGKTFEPANVRRARLKIPGQDPMDADEAPDASEPVPKPKARGKFSLQLAGRVIELTEYVLADGVVAGWSKAVPGVGLTHVRGPEPVLLVAFGAGGDPWEGAGRTAKWPASSPAQEAPQIPPPRAPEAPAAAQQPSAP